LFPLTSLKPWFYWNALFLVTLNLFICFKRIVSLSSFNVQFRSNVLCFCYLQMPHFSSMSYPSRYLHSLPSLFDSDVSFFFKIFVFHFPSNTLVSLPVWYAWITYHLIGYWAPVASVIWQRMPWKGDLCRPSTLSCISVSVVRNGHIASGRRKNFLLNGLGRILSVTLNPGGQ